MSFIYGLVDPRTQFLRYVGKSADPNRRLKQHIAEARRRQSFATRRWVWHLIGLGLGPELVVLDEAPEAEINDAECFWIAAMRLAGCALTNIKPGGDGQPRGYVRPRAAVERGAAKLRGRKRSPEQRARLVAAFTTPQMRERRRQIVEELKANNPEWLAAVRRSNVGRVMSPEARRKQSLAWTPERRAAHIAAKKGICTDTQRATLAACRKARWDKHWAEKKRGSGA